MDIHGFRVRGFWFQFLVFTHGFVGSDTRNTAVLGRIFKLTRGAPSGPRLFQPTRSPPRKPKYISVESFSPQPSALIRIHPGADTAAAQPHPHPPDGVTSDGRRRLVPSPHGRTQVRRRILIDDSGVSKSNLLSRFTRNEFSLEFRLPAVPPTRRGEPSVLLPSSLSAAAFHPFVSPPLRCFLIAGLLTGAALAAAAVYRCGAWGRRRICGAAGGARSGARLRGS